MSKLFIRVIWFVGILMASSSASAILKMELTQGMVGAVPIAIVPFAGSGQEGQEVADIIASDLQNSGRFKVYGQSVLQFFPKEARDVSIDYFRRLGADHVVVGQVQSLGAERYRVSFQLLDMFRGKGTQAVTLTKALTISNHEWRKVAHHMSDLIYQHITGVRGVFSTKLVYVVVQRVPAPTRYILELADQDGYNPKPLLNSPQPIMSPAWSPDGKHVAYVSFEDQHASIYVQNIVTGSRRLISEFPGINGAPAWSPDGKKLALVLSKSGSPNIYMMDIDDHHLTQLTHDWYINTEPVWSPDGRSLLFTSNRSGRGPQIYQLDLASHAISRLSYDGDYNARASFTNDGKHIALIHRMTGIYKIAVLDLDAGMMRVLTSSTRDSVSPSVAPNGSMVLYDTQENDHNVLAMVSSDGHIQLRLPARDGEAQDPAWSPFLS